MLSSSAEPVCCGCVYCLSKQKRKSIARVHQCSPTVRCHTHMPRKAGMLRAKRLIIMEWSIVRANSWAQRVQREIIFHFRCVLYYYSKLFDEAHSTSSVCASENSTIRVYCTFIRFVFRLFICWASRSGHVLTIYPWDSTIAPSGRESIAGKHTQETSLDAWPYSARLHLYQPFADGYA